VIEIEAGDLPFEVAASGVYTVAAHDAAGGGGPLGVILLDDFVN